MGNTEEPINLLDLLRKYTGLTFATIFLDEKPTKSLVDLFAYALMPNHFHLIVRQKSKNGITKFTRKVLTAYSMYFNLLYNHSGILAQGAFKSRLVGNEAYFRYIFAYVHLNALSIRFPGWEKEGITRHDAARSFLSNYPYSSFYDYSIGPRPERAVIAYEETPEFLKNQNDLEELLTSFKTVVA